MDAHERGKKIAIGRGGGGGGGGSSGDYYLMKNMHITSPRRDSMIHRMYHHLNE